MSQKDGGYDELEAHTGRVPRPSRPGAAVERTRTFDAPQLEKAVRESRAEVVIDELTALPKSPADMAETAEGDQKLRVEGGGNRYNTQGPRTVVRVWKAYEFALLAHGSYVHPEQWSRGGCKPLPQAIATLAGFIGEREGGAR